MAPPDFGRSVNPISTKGGRLCLPNDTGTPGFSDLPTALLEGGSCLVDTGQVRFSMISSNEQFAYCASL